jgi:magnesium chelatase family protein
MLFKTLRASGYGLDAYRVEAQVDGGSARMSDFNVLGLPDNAVKESREGIKSTRRNCGLEFPHGQSVTINLPPADVPKEGSAFDLPMARGRTGCMDCGPFLWGVAVAVRGAAISLQEQLRDPRAAPPLTRFPYVCYP